MGFAVGAVNDRLTKVGPFPMQLRDYQGAVRWLRSKARVQGSNADSIALFGESAGGHLPVLHGLAANRPDLDGGHIPGPSVKAQAIISWFGPSDFLN